MKFMVLIPITINILFTFFIYRFFISNLTLYKMACESARSFKALGIILTILLGLMPPLFFIANHEGLSPIIVKIAASFMGIFAILLFTAIFYVIGVFLVRIVGISSVATNQAVVITELILIAWVVIDILLAFIGGAKAPIVKSVDITIDGWNKPGYRIVQLSDIHVGPINDRKFVQSIVNRVNELTPDMVVITGDIIDVPLDKILDDLRPLGELVAPTYAVLGNHEYYNGPYGLKEFLGKLNIDLLLNHSLEIDNRFYLAGITDPTGNRFGLFAPDYKRMMEPIKKDLPVVLLAHQPVSVKEVDSRVDLILTGHTHGGQIFPFNYVVHLVQPFVNGLGIYKKTGTQVYVNPGTGFWGPPMRLGTEAEITLITISI